MLAGSNRFAVDLYTQLRGAVGNIVVSPVNVAEALAIAKRGASGETAKELRAALHGKVPKAPPGVVSETALWTTTPVRKKLAANVKQLDFTNANAAASRINAWVAYKTHNNIRSLISAAMLTKETRAVLTSAIRMKAAWKYPFDVSDTYHRVFHAQGVDFDVPAMQQTTYFRYAKAPGVRVVELPYENDRLNMLIVLPDARAGLGKVEASLSAERIARWTKALRGVDVKLQLPRFTAASTLTLTKPLQRLGVKRLFDRKRGAELPGINASAEPLYISDVFQSARIQVGETGTEAAAGTAGLAMATGTEAPPPPVPFIADHPFLYIIRSGEQILFIGRVMDPRF